MGYNKMLKKYLAYLAMIIIAVIGIFTVFKLEYDTNLVTGSFVQLPDVKFLFVPLAFILFLVLVFLSLNACKRRNI